MRTARPRRLWVAALAGLAALLAGCTGIPTTSAPQVVGTLGANAPTPQPLPTPQPGEAPRAIVYDFLNNNAATDEHHAAARQYLTSEERTRWSDTAGATILDSVRIGSEFDSVHDTITVTGHVVGTLDQNGVYKPNLQGDGNSSSLGAPVPYTFGLKKVHGQWRISNVPSTGLLLSQYQFTQAYRPWAIYFYDQSEQRLVPSWRYSSLTENPGLGGWLLDQLVGGPSASPTTTSLSTDLPSIPSAAELKLQMGRQTVVELPGANQLAAEQKYRMAVQVALTLGPAAPNVPIEITDGGHPVTIPNLAATTFTAADFGSALPTESLDPALYFINYNGGISDEKGKPLPGNLGNGGYHLTSVALARVTGSQRLRVAATSGSDKSSQLLLGQTGGALHQTTPPLSGQLTRPDWMPGLDEVWIGAGSKLYRVDGNGRTHRVPIAPSSGTLAGRIVAVRLSPEGARVALVVASGGTAQIWIGTIVRSATSVQVTQAIPITPSGVVVKDVAWAGDQLTLYAVGFGRTSNDASVYSVRSDGSYWSSYGISNLGNAPDSISVAQGVYPAELAVSAGTTGSTVWILATGVTSSNLNWTNPDQGTPYTYGTNPYWVN